MTKYRAVPTIVDGIRFASKAEARRYEELRLLEKAGHISHLQCHPRYPIHVKGIKVCDYIADFQYTDDRGVRCVIVEDVKGVRTAAYRLKAKLMQAVHGITVQEVDA